MLSHCHIPEMDERAYEKSNANNKLTHISTVGLDQVYDDDDLLYGYKPKREEKRIS